MPPLDAEENALLELIELGEWQSIQNATEEIARYQHYAQAQVNALESIRIELPPDDLQAFRVVAQQSGVSVSVLMATVLHQFITNRQD